MQKENFVRANNEIYVEENIAYIEQNAWIFQEDKIARILRSIC
jgi:hypothetical protein